jgi:hypothetical protein
MLLRAKSNANFKMGMTYTYSNETPILLTGAVPWMQIRNKAGGDTLIYDSEGTDHFTVNENAGTIALVIPVALVETWTFKRAEWDILLVYPTGPEPFMSGTIELDIGVTKEVTP